MKAPESYNVFGTFKLPDIDLQRIAGTLEGAVYIPETSPSMDIYAPPCMFRVFPSGSVACTGPTQDEVRLAATKLADRLRKLGVRVEPLSIIFHSQNFVINLGRKLRLVKAMYLLKGSQLSTKGPRFLDYRPDSPNVAFQLFESGKVVCLGAKNSKDYLEAYFHIMRAVEELGLAVGR